MERFLARQGSTASQSPSSAVMRFREREGSAVSLGGERSGKNVHPSSPKREGQRSTGQIPGSVRSLRRLTDSSRSQGQGWSPDSTTRGSYAKVLNKRRVSSAVDSKMEDNVYNQIVHQEERAGLRSGELGIFTSGHQCPHATASLVPLVNEGSFADLLEFIHVNREKCNFNVLDKFGHSMLHVAASRGEGASVSALLDVGASPKMVIKGGLLPIHVSTSSQGTRYLLEHDHREVSPVNALCDNFRTPLMYAAQLGHNDTIDVLVSKGAKLDLQDHDGYTALHHAAENNHAMACEALLKHGACGDVKNATSSMAMHLAAKHGHGAVCAALVRDTPKDARDNAGRAPVDVASVMGRLGALQTLLNSGFISAGYSLEEEVQDILGALTNSPPSAMAGSIPRKDH